MIHNAKSIRAFIGAINFEESRNFYTDLGFEESVIDASMSYFQVSPTVGFYLQNAYVKDWVDNTMIFLEVDDVANYYDELQSLELHKKYKTVRLTAIHTHNWGRECFLHDPSGVLWHFGEFH